MTLEPEGEPPPLFHIRIARPLLVASFAEPQAVLSWAMRRPGFETADRVVWREVAREDLTLDVDPQALLAASLIEAGLDDAVAMMTSRDVRSARNAVAASGGIVAQCVATVGLNNAERAGGVAAPIERTGHGTINLLAAVSTPLTQAALVEALSIATEARTAAVMDLDWEVEGGLATGTGTDCVVMAAPSDGAGAPFAGLHTDIGRAIGAAVYRAVSEAGLEWIVERGRPERWALGPTGGLG
jgi:adenosylcobinamide amidohydrolase